MRLVACTSCHRQFDVTNVPQATFVCSCGETVANETHRAVEASVHRCGSCGAAVPERSLVCEYCDSEIVRADEHRSLICPECYARCHDESRFCTACGVAFRPEAIPGSFEIVPCIDCGKDTVPQSIAGSPVGECPVCHGLWIPDGHFEELVKRAVAARRETPAESSAPRMRGGNPTKGGVRYRKCPICEQFMQRRNYRRSSGVIIDRCHEHGTWLDADELEQIAGFVLSGGLAKADAVEATAANEEDRRRRARATAEFHRILNDPNPRRVERNVWGSVARILDHLLS